MEKQYKLIVVYCLILHNKLKVQRKALITGWTSHSCCSYFKNVLINCRHRLKILAYIC